MKQDVRMEEYVKDIPMQQKQKVLLPLSNLSRRDS